MSLGLVLPTVALLSATPEEPASPPAPFVQVAPATALPSTAPETVAPAQAAEPALVDPLVDPATAAPVIEAAPAGSIERTPGDPLENFNRRMFSAFQNTDRKFIRPAAMAYKQVVPKPVRSGIRNVLSNLGEPIVFLNDLLQLKPGRALRTLVRFAANSTIGIGGLVDVAKTPAVKLPHRSNGFGNTLAYYGVGPGPYLFLPFVGPTTLRDLIGGQGDGFVLPVAVGNPFDRWQFQVPRGVLGALDQRAESDGDMKALLDGAVDPYATLRSVYLQNRAAEIQELHSHATTGASPLDESLSDPAGGTPSPLDDPLSDPAKGAAPSKATGNASVGAHVTPASPAPDSASPLSDPLADPAAPANP